MKKNSIKTKWDEIVIKTSDPKQMLNKYLVSPLVRKWEETFKDEETHEDVTIVRSELILEAGTCLTPDNLQKVQFHQQTGDIKDPIAVSNMRRAGYEVISDSLSPWVANVYRNDKNYKILVHANGAGNVLEIVNDWCSLNTDSMFSITAIKKSDDAIILVDILRNVSAEEAAILYLKDQIDASQYLSMAADNKSGEDKLDDSSLSYYQIKARIKQSNAADIFQMFIVKSANADRAIMVINAWIQLQEKIRSDRSGSKPSEIFATIEESKIITINTYIPREFSDAYIEGKERVKATH